MVMATDDRASSPPPTVRTLAAIDVGTNSIHMVVVQIRTEIPAFSIISKEKATARLGERDPLTGELTVAAMARATEALRRCQAIAKSLNAEQILAVATSAVREAPNGPAFVEQVYSDLGLAIDLIAGTEEARRIYLGVLSGLEFQTVPHLIIDIGGGSTELILGAGQEPLCLTSTKVGAVRLTEQFITSDPINDADFQAMQFHARGMLERAIQDVQDAIPPDVVPRMIGTSGTIEALATLQALRKQGSVPEPMNGHCFSLKELQEIIATLRKLTLAERAAMPGMNDRRAEILLAGAVILQEAMVQLKQTEIQICERALREGVIVDWMLNHGLIEDRLRYQSSVRERSVYHSAQKFQVNLPYGQRVAALTLSLFDQLQGVLHLWQDDARSLLWAAAVLHNCGHYVSHSGHHKHSYYLIRHGGLLGYNETEIEAIANLARYHRRNSPKKKHENFRSLNSKVHRQMVEQLSPLLRLAVALDRRQIGAIDQIHCEWNPLDRTLKLNLTPSEPGDDCALELWSLMSKKEEFERAYQLKLVPKIVGGEGIANPGNIKEAS
jgi:exopolyphosphatase / guanosine-5'-triphosphate,3'-diphosphate pyrophosphatase